MPTAQSLASSMIAKDVYELKMKMDDLQHRMSRVESLIIKQQVKYYVISNMSAMQTQKLEQT